MGTGKSAPRRQGAVAFDVSASETNPMLVGGIYMDSPSSVDNNDAAWFPTGPYGEQWVAHFNQTTSLTIGSAVADQSFSGSLDFRSYRTMNLVMPTAWTSSSVCFYGASAQSGSYRAMYDAEGNAVQVEAAACRTVVAPSGIQGALWLKLYGGDTPGTCVGQASDRVIGVILKA